MATPGHAGAAGGDAGEDPPVSWFLHTPGKLAELLAPMTSLGDVAGLLRPPRPPARVHKAFELICALPALEAVADPDALFAAIKRWAIEGARRWEQAGPDALGPSTFVFDDDDDGNSNGEEAVPPGVEVREARGVRMRVRTRTFTAGECRGLLANAFLGNLLDAAAPFKDRFNAGGLSFRRMYQEGSPAPARLPVGLQKLAALVLYFQAGLRLEGTPDDARKVVFEHIRGPSLPEVEALLAASSEVLVAEGEAGPGVVLHADPMEAVASTAFVNFANSNYGYGHFIPSCTQEEILQMQFPEFNVGMLFIGRMLEDEVVNVRGCRRFCQYRGYLDSFEVTGPLPPDAPHAVQDILTLDATFQSHFRKDVILRDIRKALLSFAALQPPDNGVAGAADPGPTAGAAMPGGRPVVSTGRWGCGVFYGLPAHKFLQQVLAARLAGVDLAFSTFGTPDGCDTVLAALRARPCSVQCGWALLTTATERASFLEDAVEFLSEQ